MWTGLVHVAFQMIKEIDSCNRVLLTSNLLSNISLVASQSSVNLLLAL